MVEEDQQDRGSRLKVESGEENNKKVERGEKEETVLRNEFIIHHHSPEPLCHWHR